LAEFVSNYGVWLVAAFIALESIGLPLPAEAALIAAAFFAARTHDIDIWSLISAAIIAATLGEIAGFWIGRRFGHRLLMRYGARLGFTEERIRIGQWLFVRYGGRFVFIARFLPFLRNVAAVLAGTNSMGQHSFYFASATAAVAWIICSPAPWASNHENSLAVLECGGYDSSGAAVSARRRCWLE
jgi:membrane protein DedA with SNARE-associated domain